MYNFFVLYISCLIMMMTNKRLCSHICALVIKYVFYFHSGSFTSQTKNTKFSKFVFVIYFITNLMLEQHKIYDH